MTRETLSAAVLVWLAGAVVGWCAGWAARGEQNRAFHHGAGRALARARAELTAALGELDDLRAGLGTIAQATPAVVHVHVAGPSPWTPPPPPPLVATAARVPGAAPAGPVVAAIDGVSS